MQQRSIGGHTVSAIGVGGMLLSIAGRPDEDRSIAATHAALHAGVTFIDTAAAHPLEANEVGHNGELVIRALREYGSGADGVIVTTKGGHLRPGDGAWTRNGDPAYLKRAAKESTCRLGVDANGLYQFRRRAPAVSYAASVGAICDLLDEGVIVMVGISNADVALIDAAREILGGRLVSVENPFSPALPSSLGELEHCAGPDVAFPPWSPLGRHQERQVAGRPPQRVPRGCGRGGCRRLPGHAGAGTRPLARCHPDPRRLPSRQHP